ncbi:hypothetical protein [Paraphotobacterium marinum]|uniref:hypothetical protein n=1 Tax=Paraphotobacterium marinum TaxID=1755811 RepID=UPI0013142D58|nr:hypothetical protein [Paraphotobacterium marinum]
MKKKHIINLKRKNELSPKQAAQLLLLKIEMMKVEIQKAEKKLKNISNQIK